MKTMAITLLMLSTTTEGKDPAEEPKTYTRAEFTKDMTQLTLPEKSLIRRYTFFINHNPIETIEDLEMHLSFLKSIRAKKYVDLWRFMIDNGGHHEGIKIHPNHLPRLIDVFLSNEFNEDEKKLYLRSCLLINELNADPYIVKLFKNRRASFPSDEAFKDFLLSFQVESIYNYAPIIQALVFSGTTTARGFREYLRINEKTPMLPDSYICGYNPSLLTYVLKKFPTASPEDKLDLIYQETMNYPQAHYLISAQETKIKEQKNIPDSFIKDLEKDGIIDLIKNCSNRLEFDVKICQVLINSKKISDASLQFLTIELITANHPYQFYKENIIDIKNLGSNENIAKIGSYILGAGGFLDDEKTLALIEDIKNKGGLNGIAPAIARSYPAILKTKGKYKNDLGNIVLEELINDIKKSKEIASDFFLVDRATNILAFSEDDPTENARKLANSIFRNKSPNKDNAIFYSNCGHVILIKLEIIRKNRKDKSDWDVDRLKKIEKEIMALDRTSTEWADFFSKYKY